ncbi:MAG: plasmid mobilization relaxosome protein MobC [Eubacteriales bacterium]
MADENRTRKKQLIVRVDEEEYEIIQKKMEVINATSFSQYARRMLIFGMMIEVDLSLYRELAHEVNKVGVNVNQVAKLCNETKSVSPEQVKRMEDLLEEIWHTLKLSLLEIQSASQ